MSTMIRKGISIAASAALSMALIPAAAFAAVAPETPSIQLDITRAATGSVTLKKGTSYKLGAVATNGAKLSYKTSKKSVATVSAKGKVHIKKTGKAVITVRAKTGKRAAVQRILVTGVSPSRYRAVKSVSVSLPQEILHIGDSASLDATVKPEKASNKNLTFESSDPSVVSVSPKGIVTARAQGTASVKATSCDNKKASTTVPIEVKPIEENEQEPSPDNGANNDNSNQSDSPGSSSSGSLPGGGTSGNVSGGGSSSGGSNGGGASSGDSNGEPPVISSDSITIDKDYNSTITYANNVHTLASSNYSITTDSTGATNVQISSADIPDVANYKAGEVIVLEPTSTNPNGCMVTIESITSSSDATTISGTVPELDEVIKDIDAQGVSDQPISFEPAEGVTVEDKLQTMGLARAAKPGGTDSDSLGTLTLKVPDMNLGNSAKLSLEFKFKAAIEYLIKGFGKDMTAYIGLNQTTTLATKIKTNGPSGKLKKKDVRLGRLGFPTQIPGAFIFINIYGSVGFDGSIALSYSSAGDLGWLYRNGKNQMVTSLQQDCDGVELSADISSGVDFDVSFNALSKPLIDAAIGVEEKLSGDITLRPNNLICIGAKADTYGKISIGEHSQLGDFGIKYKNEIDLGKYFPKLKLKFHFENGKKVSECTWNDTSGDYGYAGDFKYEIRDDNYGYGAYATYVGDGGAVDVPYEMGGEPVVSVICDNSGITGLNVMKCTELQNLWCNGNNISYLNLFNCKKLRYLDCSSNDLTELDVTKCSELTNLYCASRESGWGSSNGPGVGPKLKELDVTKCVKLLQFYCFNNELKELDLSKCINLASLNCADNQLTHLDISKCACLDNLNCDSNKLTELDLSNCIWLKHLICGYNYIEKLNVSSCSELQTLSCSLQNGPYDAQGWSPYGRMKELDISKCAKLEILECPDNALSSIKLPTETVLKTIDCEHNNLVSLDLSNCPNLQNLNCTQQWNDCLETLDIHSCTNLRVLQCSYNKALKTLDLTPLANLTELGCKGMNLGSLNLKFNTKLETLKCSYNSLNILDVSSCPLLKSLHCENNQLTELDLSQCLTLGELTVDPLVSVKGYQGKVDYI